MSDRLALVALVIAVVFSAGCNFKDELTGPPRAGCEDDGDCNDNGTCEIDNGVGTCACDIGYSGNRCRDCDDGYEENLDGDCVLAANNTNNNGTNTNNTTPTNNNNNTNGECGDGEIMMDGMCITDGCANAPCGDGTCTVTGNGTWQCMCPNGSTGIECPSCAATCINGTCDVDGACICDTGWAPPSCNVCNPRFSGPNCDMCAPNAFGPNCDNCATLNAATPWWDMAYSHRAALFVFNPPQATQAVLDGSVVQHELNHLALRNQMMALEPGGDDVRIVASGNTEIDRVLGVDTDFNQSDTTLWFATQGSLQPGAFQVYYRYSGNATPTPAMEDPNGVLLQNRGWWYANGNAIYSHNPRTVGQYSVHVRQRNPMVIEVYFHDSGDDLTAGAQVNFVDTATGASVATRTYGGSQGSAAVPFDLPDAVMGLPNTLRLEILINAGDLDNETAGIYVGGQLINSGTSTLTFTTTLSRVNNPSGVPSVFTCAPEAAP